MEIDQEIFNMMLAKSMHQIARIEFRNSKFPYARGLCPLATPARGLCPLDPRQRTSPLKPPSLVNNLGPPLSSAWIRPWLVVMGASTTHMVCCHQMRIFNTSLAYLFWLAYNKKSNIQSSVWATLMKLGKWVVMGTSTMFCCHQMCIFNTSFAYLL